VSLDHIAFDYGCMACAGFDWNSQALFVAGKVVVFCALYLGSVVLQVPDPACAASSAGGLVHVDGDTLQDS
jgi:hypothetical protein